MKSSGRKRKKRSKSRKKFKLSRKLIILFCCIFVIIIVAAAIVWSRASEQMPSDPLENETVNNASDLDAEKRQDTEKESDTDKESENVDGNNSGQDTSESIAGLDSGAASETVLQEGVQGLTLPYNIPGSGLVVRGISSYDGIYLEDGSDENISGVTVMLLQNAGETEVEYASVSVNRDGTPLQFEASALPAGATVVVQEKSRTPFQEGNYTDCSANVAEVNEFGMADEQIQIEETGEQEITVTNLTDQKIPAVRIFYKFYMEDEAAYVGGITYTAKITNLNAGASQTITPSHYLKGSSKIMMVRTYDTAD